MPMRLKLNDDGFAFVSDDGHPVYLLGEEDDDSPEEQAVDVPALYVKVPELTTESAKHRKQRNEARDSLKLFEGIEDIPAWKTAAEKAIETVKNFDDKQLVEAGKVEQIKSAMTEAHTQELSDVRGSFETKITEITEASAAKDNIIYSLMVRSKFAQSPYFSGTEENPPKTLIPPEMAETYFGKQFKVEPGEGENAELQTIGYDSAGNQLYSRKRPGELANFEEALEQIINAYPGKDAIMRGSKAGSGAGPGGGGGGVGEIEKLQAEYAEAQKAGDSKAMISLKNRIHTLRMAAQNKSSQAA